MLDISWMLLGSTLVVFLLLIVILNSLLYKPLFSYMEKRDADIKKDMELVGSNDSEVSAYHAEAEKIINEAKLEAAILREKTVAEAKAQAQSKIDAKRTELAKEYEAFKAELSQQKTNLLESLSAEMPAFQTAIATKLSKI